MVNYIQWDLISVYQRPNHWSPSCASSKMHLSDIITGYGPLENKASP